jgi:hypothetical protein
MPRQPIYLDQLSYEYAIANGRLDIVKFLHKSGTRSNNMHFQNAVMNRRHEIVRYMLASNMPYFDFHNGEDIASIGGVKPVDVAIDNGDYKMMRILLYHGLFRDRVSWNHALDHGGRRVLKILYDFNCPHDYDEDIIDEVAQFGINLY